MERAIYCRYFSVARHAVEFCEIEICLLRAVRPDQNTPPVESDHDPICAMARLIASRVMPSFSCFPINAR